MQPPIVSGLRELDSAPRRFLLFIAFNVVSWQCIIGPALVLLARKIDMPPSWVGFLISFTPLSTLLVVLTVQLVMRLGPRRVMLTAWFLRNLITCTVFLMPWAIVHHGQRAGWYVLLTATLGFCLMRAVGAGGWFPWLHEVVPESQRSTYFGSEAAITQLLNVGVAVGQALILHGNPGLDRYLYIYGIGIAAGLLSLTWMRRVPGGAGVKTPFSWHDIHLPYRETLADRPFLVFVAVTSLCLLTTTCFGSSWVLYSRDVLGYTSNKIMYITAAASFGVILTIRPWTRFAEHNGSGPCMFLTLATHSVLSLLFIGNVPGAPWSAWGVMPIIVLMNSFGTAFIVAANRGMLNYFQPDSRLGYSNIWTVGTSLAYGLAPIYAGQCIQHVGLWGYRICFMLCGFGGLLMAFTCLVAVKERAARPAHGFTFGPLGLVRTAVRIVTITAGFDVSNRHGKPARISGAEAEI